MFIMTDSLEHQLSVAALEAMTPEGARELAAAQVMVKATTLLWKAFERSGLSQRELAEALDVSEGRVSQVLHGDGNVRLSTLARYLRATGYLAQLDAVPADSSVPPLRSRVSRRKRHLGPSLHDVYVTEVAHGGTTTFKLTAIPHGVPLDAVETSAASHVGQTRTRLVMKPVPKQKEVSAE